MATNASSNKPEFPVVFLPEWASVSHKQDAYGAVLLGRGPWVGSGLSGLKTAPENADAESRLWKRRMELELWARNRAFPCGRDPPRKSGS